MKTRSSRVNRFPTDLVLSGRVLLDEAAVGSDPGGLDVALGPADQPGVRADLLQVGAHPLEDARGRSLEVQEVPGNATVGLKT